MHTPSATRGRRGEVKSETMIIIENGGASQGRPWHGMGWDGIIGMAWNERE